MVPNTHWVEVKEMLLLNSLNSWILGIPGIFVEKIEWRPQPLVASWENKCIRDTAHCSPKQIASYTEDNTLSCLSLSPCFHRLSAKKLGVLMLCIFNSRGGSESEKKSGKIPRLWRVLRGFFFPGGPGSWGHESPQLHVQLTSDLLIYSGIWNLASSSFAGIHLRTTSRLQFARASRPTTKRIVLATNLNLLLSALVIHGFLQKCPPSRMFVPFLW